MEDREIIRYTVRVRGRVQGVGFRYSAVNKAEQLQISGFVKNMPDGSVTLEIEGTPENVQKMLAWCYQGPRTGWVDKVQEYQEPPKGYRGFSVKY